MKLIEVSLPLEAINTASAQEKSIRQGHPSTLHLWWARRPLAAARAVIFAQMVDDPSSHPERFPTDEAQEIERQRLFRLIEELVTWENTTNETVLSLARKEIWQSWRDTCAVNADHAGATDLFDPKMLPSFHDPFAGGGALPLEAQRLGLESHASDLNPVAVLICKAMIDIPPKFAGCRPVNPTALAEKRLLKSAWHGAAGLSEDVRFYGSWMRDEAKKRIGGLYPKVEITREMATSRPDLLPLVGSSLTVIAWVWTRTVESPNPAFASVHVPLASTFMLATKKGKEAYVQPIIDGKSYRFTVKAERPRNPDSTKAGTKLARGAHFRCLMSNTPLTPEYIKAEGVAGRIGARLMAVVADGEHGRVYLSPRVEDEEIARQARPAWKPETPLPNDPRNFWTPSYGLNTFGELFTARQLVALTTFSDLIGEARDKVRRDALVAGMPDDKDGLESGGRGAAAYADAVAVHLSFALSKQADLGNSLCGWEPIAQCPRHLFSRQAIPMVWDFVEGNPLSNSSGGWEVLLDGICKAILKTFGDAGSLSGGNAFQADAGALSVSNGKIISTDPPYYDNISYADLSEFFYVWMRRSLKVAFPNLFSTLAVPKAEELIATPYRHAGKDSADVFFKDGMTRAMHQLTKQAHPAFPVTIYYAFKQSESAGDDGTASTGWESFLEAVIQAGFVLSGTWPIRTENSSRMIGQGTNALASSIVLVCRPRAAKAPIATRREFLTALRAELPGALIHLQRANIAPVDLAQAGIGPGMAVYTRYSRVLDAAGNSLTVREALALINQSLDEVLTQQEGDFDVDTRWALAWFEQSGFAEGAYGMAETLSKAKNTSVFGMVGAGILASSRGRVRLLRPSELPTTWDPADDRRLAAWEIVHHLIKSLETGGERQAAALVAKLGTRAEVARQLAYRLYTLSERKKRASEALSYNSLVQSWPEIARLAREGDGPRAQQAGLFEEG